MEPCTRPPAPFVNLTRAACWSSQAILFLSSRIHMSQKTSRPQKNHLDAGHISGAEPGFCSCPRISWLGRKNSTLKPCCHLDGFHCDGLSTNQHFLNRSLFHLVLSWGSFISVLMYSNLISLYLASMYHSLTFKEDCWQPGLSHLGNDKVCTTIWRRLTRYRFGNLRSQDLVRLSTIMSDSGVLTIYQWEGLNACKFRYICKFISHTHTKSAFDKIMLA